MNIYKENFVNFDHNLKNYEEIDLTNKSYSTVKTPFDMKPRGFAFSNSKYILFGYVSSNKLKEL